MAGLPEVRRTIVAGIGALPIHVAKRDAQAGSLRQLPPRSGVPAVDVHLVTNPNRSPNRDERRLIETLTALIGGLGVGERACL